MAVVNTLAINAVTNFEKAQQGLDNLKNHAQSTVPHLEELGHEHGLEALGERLEHVGLHAAGLNRHLIGLVTHFGPLGIAAAGAFAAFEKIHELSEEHEKELQKIEEHWKAIEHDIESIQKESDQFGFSKQQKQLADIETKLKAQNEEITKANSGWWATVSAQAQLLANGGTGGTFWEEVAKLQTPLVNVAEELEKAKKAAEELEGKERFKRANEAISKYKEHVKELKETEGKSKGEIELYKLKVELLKQGAEGAERWKWQQEELTKQAKEMDAIEERAKKAKEAEAEAKRKAHELEIEDQKLQQKADALLEQSLTKEERYAKKLEEINDLKAKGKLTDEQAAKISGRAKDDFEKEERDRAKRIMDEAMTKEEKLQAKIKEISDNKFLDEKQKEKAIADAREKAKDKEEKEHKEKHHQEHQFAGAAILGTDAARKSIIQAMYGGGNKLEENTKKTADATQKMVKQLSKPNIRLMAVGPN